MDCTQRRCVTVLSEELTSDGNRVRSWTCYMVEVVTGAYRYRNRGFFSSAAVRLPNISLSKNPFPAIKLLGEILEVLFWLLVLFLHCGHLLSNICMELFGHHFTRMGRSGVMHYSLVIRSQAFGLAAFGHITWDFFADGEEDKEEYFFNKIFVQLVLENDICFLSNEFSFEERERSGSGESATDDIDRQENLKTYLLYHQGYWSKWLGMCRDLFNTMNHEILPFENSVEWPGTSTKETKPKRMHRKSECVEIYPYNFSETVEISDTTAASKRIRKIYQCMVWSGLVEVVVCACFVLLSVGFYCCCVLGAAFCLLLLRARCYFLPSTIAAIYRLCFQVFANFFFLMPGGVCVVSVLVRICVQTGV
ncbi:hypothetical protein IFM89_028226 [Coptis chinensis]|uniref:Uncharacterized protein n=1 Tax=Coptis chinensis TaxID=261450 RepID=A0A835M6R6_9MAGN|nr:hypothetical protein IFM89_028226 [Coptis chinensis]